jgi:V8-like Glu-specific endopeptidase
MKTFNAVFTSALLLLPAASFAGGMANKSIYGSDDRQDFYAASYDMQALSDSVVSFWKADKVQASGSGITLKTTNFGDTMNLCPQERFRDQTLGAFCSGSLVGPDMVMTAGHCVKSASDCQNIRIAFGYKVPQAGAAPVTTLPSSEVYSCSSIVKRFLAGEPGSNNPAGQDLGPDYALIKLDRPVSGHKPLAINRGANLKAGDGVFVIGHPVGLPLKVTTNGTVRDFSKVGYFVTNLDTFGGNSGSPVFNTRTKLIEGILVRGDEDFKDDPAGCTTMATYAQTGGRGEDVTKISAVSSFIPGAAKAKSAEPQEPKVMEMDPNDMPEVPAKAISFD